MGLAGSRSGARPFGAGRRSAGPGARPSEVGRRCLARGHRGRALLDFGVRGVEELAHLEGERGGVFELLGDALAELSAVDEEAVGVDARVARADSGRRGGLDALELNNERLARRERLGRGVAELVDSVEDALGLDPLLRGPARGQRDRDRDRGRSTRWSRYLPARPGAHQSAALGGGPIWMRSPRKAPTSPKRTPMSPMIAYIKKGIVCTVCQRQRKSTVGACTTNVARVGSA